MKLHCSENLSESSNKIVPNSMNDGLKTGSPIESNLKNPSKPKSKLKKKHVTFVDQTLDETIGAEPFEDKILEQKSDDLNLKKSSNNSSFNYYPIAHFTLLLTSFSVLILIIF